MAFGVETILGWNALTKSVQLTKNGLPDYLPKPFFTITEEVPFDKAQYIEYFGMRKLARRVPYGSPGRASGKLELAQKDIRLMNFREITPLNNELIQGFRQWDKYELQQKGAINQIDYHGRNARSRFDNIRKAVMMGSVAFGANYFDSEGYLLPNASGADTSKTVDQLIPSANKGLITDTDGSTVIVNASWLLPSTNIVQQILNLQAVAMKRTGIPLKYAFYGKNVAGYIQANTSARSYWPFAANGVNAISVMGGKVPEGFMGLEWIPVQSAFFEQEDGTIVEQFPADQVTFFPEVTSDTYTLYEGTTKVPTMIGITDNLNSAFNSFKDVVGMGGYAKSDEFSISLNYFDVFLPRFKVPQSVFLMGTAP